MAIVKAKRSGEKQQLTKKKQDSEVRSRKFGRTRSKRQKQSRSNRKQSTQPTTSTALLERHFPGRRFVQFPQVHGKTVDKIDFFTSLESHSFTISFQDSTALNLEIEPGFILHAELQQEEKGELEIVAEWRDIPSHTQSRN